MIENDNNQVEISGEGQRQPALDTVAEKLRDAATPGYQVEFDPDEADRVGAFVEDALTEEDAAESMTDLTVSDAANDDDRDQEG